MNDAGQSVQGVRSIGWVLAGCILCAVLNGVMARGATNGTSKADMDLFQQQVGQWLALKAACAAEGTDWRETEQRFQEELRLLELRVTQLEQEKQRLDAALSSRDTEQETLLRHANETERALRSLDALPGEAETTLQRLFHQIPASLQTDLRPAMNEAGREGLSTVQRLRYLLDVYGQIEQLQQGTHVVTELMEISPGERREVDVLYLGLSAGYAVSKDAQWAALGRPGEEGWVWQSAPAHAEEIRQAVRVHRNEEPPVLVRLPLVLDREAD